MLVLLKMQKLRVSPTPHLCETFLSSCLRVRPLFLPGLHRRRCLFELSSIHALNSQIAPVPLPLPLTLPLPPATPSPSPSPSSSSSSCSSPSTRTLFTDPPSNHIEIESCRLQPPLFRIT